MSQKYNSLDAHFFPTKPGMFGVELELEGTFAPLEDPAGLYWAVVPENSLRSGVELVLRKPLAYTPLQRALKSLDSFFKESSIKPSIRCSTHVHVNMTKQTMRQVYSSIIKYFLLEEFITADIPKSRKGNLFCLRLRDAEDLGFCVLDSIKKELDPSGCFSLSQFKYGAVNLAALGKFGSLEFRFLPAITDKDTLLRWCRIFRDVVSTDLSADAFLADYNNLPVKTFLRKHISDADFLINDRSSKELNALLHVNYAVCEEMAEALRAKKFSLPREFWEEDLSQRPDSPASHVWHSFVAPPPSDTVDHFFTQTS